MSGPLVSAVGAFVAQDRKPYLINQSLRFNSADSAYLNRTPGSAGNRQRFTISFWIKRGTLGTTELFTGKGVAGFLSTLLSAGELYLFDYGAASGGFQIYSQRVLRDPSSWYHIVIAVDTTQATDSNRIKVYINGDQENLATWNVGAGASRYPALNSNFDWNNTDSHKIGNNPNGYFNGYFAEFYNIDGSQLTPSSFGETDTITGAWIPKRYSGSYTGNSFYLKFANGDGTDSSGLSNTWTANNFTTSGTGTDVMSDTPTTNYATFNPLQTRGSSLSNGNLDASFTAGNDNYASYITQGITSGKYYLEVTCTSSTTSASNVGFVGDNNLTAKQASTANAVPGQQGTYGRGVDGTGTLYNGSGVSDGSYMAAWSQNDVIMVAIDADAGKFWLGANGNWANGSGSTNQANLTVGAEINLSSSTAPYTFGVGDSSGSVAASFILNAGQRSFSYTPPTGYKALNTQNLPEPTIKDGGKYFDTVLWTGNQTARTISMNSTFTPDFIWIKNRTSGYNHSLQDVVRGFGPSTKLNSNTTTAENSANTEPQAGYVNSAAAGSFDIDASATATWYHNNLNSNAYVAWCWDAGGAGSSNNAGTITSTVSANASAGFSIVTYTSPNNSADQTVGHGLGVKPSLIIVKNRDLTYNWDIYHSSLGYNASLIFTTAGTRSGAFGAEPTSTVFTTKTGYTHNSTNKYVAYCFAEVEGYSKFGSYTGNGSSDGPFVYCGFRPAYFLTKNTGSSAWLLLDIARGQYSNPIGYKNSTKESLYASGAAAESGTGLGFEVDFLSNGFKMRSSVPGELNEGGSTHIFAAFAELPFKYANAR
jgi:hypothetical protein